MRCFTPVHPCLRQPVSITAKRCRLSIRHALSLLPALLARGIDERPGDDFPTVFPSTSSPSLPQFFASDQTGPPQCFAPAMQAGLPAVHSSFQVRSSSQSLPPVVGCTWE